MVDELEGFIEYFGLKQDFESFLLEKHIDNSKEAIVKFLQDRNLLEAYERWVAESDRINLVERYINLEDWEVKENSNMTYSLQGLNFYITSQVSRTYWLEKIYPKKIKEAHLRGIYTYMTFRF